MIGPERVAELVDQAASTGQIHVTPEEWEWLKDAVPPPRLPNLATIGSLNWWSGVAVFVDG